MSFTPHDYPQARRSAEQFRQAAQDKFWMQVSGALRGIFARIKARFERGSTACTALSPHTAA
jgi:hypothetical protein